TTPKDGWMIDDFQVMANMEGIDEHYMSNNVSISPNPASNNINYTFSKKLNSPTDIAVYNSSGEKVIEKTISDNGSINVSNFDAGIYFAIFKNKNFYETKKISIRK
ncbi:MAG: T9SS type A sorting domain-containing protein, partial [Bacteroidia bacterium]